MKLLVVVTAVFLVSCANSKYPGWQNVEPIASVENKSCVKRGNTEQCRDTWDDCDVWFRKRATLVKANTFVYGGSELNYTGRYYDCREGLPAYSSPTFDASGYGPGLNTVTGQAFLTQVGGGVVTCAGNVVEMRPDQRYFNERYADIDRGIAPEFSLSREAQSFVHTSQCDAQGNFEFRNIPAGKWVISTNVSWGVGVVKYSGWVGFYRDISKQGGDVRKSVTVQDGEPNRFIVSP